MQLEQTTLGDSEVRRLIAVIPKGKAGDRNRALLDLLFHSGLRIGEALALRRGDIDGRRLHVRNGKGGKARLVVLTQTYGHWDRWLEGSGEVIFATREGEEMSQDYVRGMLSRLKKKAGFTGRVHAHAMRHGHATAVFEAVGDLAVVSKQLGHGRLSTTDVYLRGLMVDTSGLATLSLG